jgi:hypothetical protein
MNAKQASWIVGAGLGSRWGILRVTRGGKERQFRFDAEQLIRAVDDATAE